MKLMIVAVGTRMPAWVDAGFDEFARRMPRELPLQLIEVKAEPRTTGKTVEAMMAAEAGRIEAVLPPHVRRVVLDERGQDLTTLELSRRLAHWQSLGADVALIVGGPDGLARPIKDSADERMRLSSLTLPHALVRPLLGEALYRAWTVLRNHPYHRE
ncbi:MAG TPA: 23S rRNA (pseudouridine(1915)-N(3))-methyltransferase RlmH [Rhodocyclaceae bacterium]|nr:23S rRNA (pseudouridine(1915)-N(3))-methyltransferase RlmH [Rhodocyclaceae bacterium]